MLWLILAVLAAGFILSGGKPWLLLRRLAARYAPSGRTLIVVALALLSLMSLRTGRLPAAAGLALVALAVGLYAKHAEAPKNAQRPGKAGSGMSVAEAYRVLGLPDGASADDVKQAHRRLMLRAHPDLGGSDYLAAKLNEAKDVLVGRG